MGARLLLPRLLLLLLLLLLHPSPSHPAVVDDELIVTFRRYDEADRQHAVLRAILLDLGEAAPELPVVAEKELRRAAATCAIAPGWRVVRRSNKACGLPTDFALLQVQGGGAGLGRRIRGALAGDARVRHVTSQRRLSRRRTLSASSDRDGAKSGGRAATADTFGPASEGLSGVEDEVNDDDGEGDLFDIDNPLTSRVRRFRPRPVPGEDPALFGDAFLEDDVADGRRRGGRRLLRTTKPGDDVARTLRAPEVWGRGITGAGVKVAIFDTGVKKPHAHFKNIDERSNWTTEDSLEDLLGHGTFSVGIVASTTDCLGFAPDASIHTYKVFTNDQISYTSWFLDAFNYAIHTGVDVLNLSIGGPDYLDEPFVEKVREATGSNVVVVSAIGNDGPLWGTLNNPADMPDVLGVGGITNDHDIARFSSRGMTTWELPRGIGRVKPDVVTYGYLRGCKIDGGCTHSSGTSVAGPVATGVVTLLASYLKNSGKHHFINPATMKQAVVESATRLVDPNKHTAAIYEQGAGNLNLIGALDVLKGYTPRPSLHPGVVDFTDCPYFWPYCEQPLYSGAMPVIVNATLVNGLGETGTIVNPPVWEPTLNGEHLDVQFTWSEVLWPWSGFVGLHLTVPAGSATWSGVVEGTVRVAVEAVPLNSALAEYAAAGGRGGVLRGEATMKLRVRVEAAPPRKKRLLFDTFHNIKYPPGFLPRDDLAETGDTLDWHADHPYTNYRAAYTALRRAGYFTELLGADFTCFDASQYAALVIVDPEVREGVGGLWGKGQSMPCLSIIVSIHTRLCSFPLHSATDLGRVFSGGANEACGRRAKQGAVFDRACRLVRLGSGEESPVL